jgi:hypothetical protein
MNGDGGMASNQTWIADCQACKHHWVSRAGYGSPDQCPSCRSTKIAMKPAK